MSDTSRMWEIVSPYLSYMEDNYLDLDSIRTLTSVIRDPALVIGGGQGLLVEELRKQGLKVDGVDAEPKMIEYAAQRRGIDLVLAQGNKMPFDDNSYATSIIATGVIDFLDDEEQIRSILAEATRVTDDDGQILVAFYRWHPKGEELGRYIGIITPQDRWRFRRSYEVFRLKPLAFIRSVARDNNVGLLGAFYTLISIQISLPKKVKRGTKRFAAMWKEVENPNELIEHVPESVPYWSEASIKTLFGNLDINIREILTLDSCYVVKL